MRVPQLHRLTPRALRWSHKIHTGHPQRHGLTGWPLFSILRAFSPVSSLSLLSAPTLGGTFSCSGSGGACIPCPPLLTHRNRLAWSARLARFAHGCSEIKSELLAHLNGQLVAVVQPDLGIRRQHRSEHLAHELGSTRRTVNASGVVKMGNLLRIHSEGKEWSSGVCHAHVKPPCYTRVQTKPLSGGGACATWHRRRRLARRVPSAVTCPAPSMRPVSYRCPTLPLKRERPALLGLDSLADRPRFHMKLRHAQRGHRPKW